MNILNGKWQEVQEKLGTSGDPTLLELGQTMRMLAANYIKSISGAAVSDQEREALMQNIPSLT